MLASSLPTKFNIPFANNAVAANTNPIPQASQIGVTAGAASLVDGFPPLTFIPITAGGIPPWGRDFNGLLNQITAWVRYNDCAGGLPIYDSSFAVAIAGYPKGSLISSSSFNGLWLSTADNNTINPDTTPSTSWIAVGFIIPIQNETYISADDVGTVNQLAFNPQPPITSYVKYQRFKTKAAFTNTGASFANVSGLGPVSIIRNTGQTLLPADIVQGGITELMYDGTNLQLATQASTNIPKTTKIIFATPGLHVFTAVVTGRHRFTLWGAGGGGGFGGGSGVNSLAGSGGSGGTYGEIVQVLATGQTANCTVGAGGSPGTSGGANGLAGGGSIVVVNSTTFNAGGGPGGLTNISGGSTNSPGVSTSSGNLDRAIAGGQGGPGYLMNNPTAAGGYGGNSSLGGNGGVGGGGTAGSGFAPGGGGGGSATSQSAGVGARGEIWVEY